MEIVDNIKDRNIEGLVKDVEILSSNGRDILRFASDLVMYFRNLLVCKLSKNPGDILDASKQYVEKMMLQSEAFSKEYIIGVIKELSSFEPQLKYALNQRVFLEVMLISISTGSYGQSTENSDMLDRISDLENAIKTGIVVRNTNNIDVLEYTELPKHIETPGHTTGKVLEGVPPVPASKSNTNDIASETAQDKTTLSKSSQAKKAESHKELEIWADVMAELKSSGRMMLSTYLASTKAISADESTIMVVFPLAVASLKKNIAKQEYIDILENILGKKLAKEVRVKLVDEDALESLLPNHESAKKEEQESELLKYTRDITSKLNVHLDIIDE
jgi:DNA polymerase-3 subunit gamma/tau